MANPIWTRPRRAHPTGKPDFSGMWGWETRANCGAHCNDFQISREFMNIAATVKGGLPYQPGVADLVKHRTANQDEDPQRPLHAAQAPRESGPTTTTSAFCSCQTASSSSPSATCSTGRSSPTAGPFRTKSEPDLETATQKPRNGKSEDTLVVQTIGFRDDLWLDAFGNPLHELGSHRENSTTEVTRSIRGRDDDRRSEVLYRAPWAVTIRQPLVLDSELLDYYC